MLDDSGVKKRFVTPNSRPLIGVLAGNGVGPEVIGAALRVLSAVGQTAGIEFELRHGGLIGEEAEAHSGKSLTDSVVEFCGKIFADGGAILNGPGGGRYVYDLRRQFDLFCKFVPIRPFPELARAGKFAPQHLENVDMLLVRDNSGGVYQGKWNCGENANGKFAEHFFSYSETQIRRIVEIAARAAANRRGKLHIIVKEGGVPGISALWRDIGLDLARKYEIRAAIMNIDLAAYALIQHPAQFDVIVAPNLFGDILADIAGVLVSSRGVTFSGNFDSQRNAVYQTNHGCAHDLAGGDVANPTGQMLSLAMLLRESFGLDGAAKKIENAIREVWRQGWRTADLAEPDCRTLGTRAMTDRVVEEIFRLAETRGLHETRAVIG
ncbi:MAG TPA: isocitrate/isopropylmalate family dehydrogenase [Verrucomicrobiae bacterium]|nr:isocitrate/isopropylmalate family dehydrogenase [Verrucomicrobiae bacterium]